MTNQNSKIKDNIKDRKESGLAGYPEITNTPGTIIIVAGELQFLPKLKQQGRRCSRK